MISILLFTDEKTNIVGKCPESYRQKMMTEHGSNQVCVTSKPLLLRLEV